MKNLLFPLAFLAISIQTQAQTTYPNGITGCIARWDFASSQTITSLVDVSNNGNDGTAVNLTSATDFRGISNRAMKFDGSSSHSIVTHKTLLTPATITMVALVKLDGFYSGYCEVSQIINKGYPHHVSGNYGMGFNDNYYDGACGTYSPNNMQQTNMLGSVSYTVPAGNYVQTGKWYFVATSYNGSTVKQYQKEMAATYNPSTTPIFTKSGLSGTIGSHTQDISIGRHLNPAYPDWFNGSMDELIIFDRALTDSEVNKIYDYLWAEVFIDQPFTDTIKHPGASMTVNYTAPGSAVFPSTNTFTVQLSDAMGSFASPINIGSTSATTSGTISCTIPTTTTPGSGYRIRIIASNPTYISVDNGKNIRIAPVGISNLSNEGYEHIRLFPNPTKGSFSIAGDATSNEPLSMEITNAVGQLVYASTISPSANRINASLQLEGAAKGVYTVQLKNAFFAKTLRVVVE